MSLLTSQAYLCDHLHIFASQGQNKRKENGGKRVENDQNS